MCKQLEMIGIRNPILAYNVAKAVESGMSTTQPHGIGYAGISPKGMFHERWLHNDMAWYHFQKNTPWYNRSASRNISTMTSMLMHTRFATSEKNIVNTHPFFRNGIYLVHNGVVHGDKLYNLYSTCDSEYILNEYVDLQVDTNIDNIIKVCDKLDGWYACGVLSERYVDMFKDFKTSLYRTLTNELGWVYCTDKELLKAGLDKYNIVYPEPEWVPDYKLYRHCNVTGDILATIDIPKKIPKYDNKWNNNTWNKGYWIKDEHGGWIYTGADNWRDDDYLDKYCSDYYAGKYAKYGSKKKHKKDNKDNNLTLIGGGSQIKGL